MKSLTGGLRLLAAASVLCAGRIALGDLAANTTVNAVGLGLDGSGVKIADVEVSSLFDGGQPQLAPDNPFMPSLDATGAGQNGAVTLYPDNYLPSDIFFVGPGNHATMVAGSIIGAGGIGIAPQAQFFNLPFVDETSQLLGTQDLVRNDPPPPGTIYPQVGIVNYSFSYTSTDPTAPSLGDGTSLPVVFQDFAANVDASSADSNVLFTVAGNEFEGTGITSYTPRDNYNGITVAATAGTDGRILADYNLSNQTADGRFKTDIVAPGGGVGNDGFVDLLQDPVMVGGGLDSGTPGLNNNPFYSGTSFASPLVAGAAGLLTQDYQISHPAAVLDHRALKALILNGASKQVGTMTIGDWHAYGNNGTKIDPTTGAAAPVYIGWDANLGTGLLDVGQSKTNLDAGQFQPGTVPPIGWNLGAIDNTGDVQDYDFSNPAGLGQITATLAWDRLVTLSPDGSTLTYYPLNDLDLKLYDLSQPGDPLVAYSTSALDSIEHIYYSVPFGAGNDTYDLQVDYFSNQDGSASTGYGLAWSAVVPEPGALGLAALGAMLILRPRPRSDRRA